MKIPLIETDLPPVFAVRLSSKSYKCIPSFFKHQFI